jgi:predicted  nucleic acid-binding Zn-ribbon protein
MSDKPIDSTTKILRKIQAELGAFRREMKDQFRALNYRIDVTNERIDSLSEYMAGAVANATEARGIAERLKERMKRLEDRQ